MTSTPSWSLSCLQLPELWLAPGGIARTDSSAMGSVRALWRTGGADRTPGRTSASVSSRSPGHGGPVRNPALRLAARSRDRESVKDLAWALLDPPVSFLPA